MNQTFFILTMALLCGLLLVAMGVVSCAVLLLRFEASKIASAVELEKRLASVAVAQSVLRKDQGTLEEIVLSARNRNASRARREKPKEEEDSDVFFPNEGSLQ